MRIPESEPGERKTNMNEIQTETAWELLQENRESFASWVRGAGFGKGMDRLETMYVDTCSEAAMEAGCAEGTLFAVRDPERVRAVLDSLTEDLRFRATDRQKNARPLLALKRYLSFCEAVPDESMPEPELIWAAMPGAQPAGAEEPEAPASGEEELPEEAGGPEAETEEPVNRAVEAEAEEQEPEAAEAETEAETEEPESEEAEAEQETEDTGPGPETAAEGPEPEPEKEPGTMEIVLGTNMEDEQPVVWYPNDTTRLFHTNTGIIGTMGTGKTQMAKSFITQLFREQPNNFTGCPLGILIFDYKGDYNETKWDFCAAVKAKIWKPYHLPFNPLTLCRTATFRPLLPNHTGNAFKDTIARTYHLGPKQQSALFRCIMGAYRAAGILPDQPRTWDRTAPTMHDVYERYRDMEDDGKGDSLKAAMEKLDMFEIFEPDAEKTRSLFDLLDGVAVIDLSGYDPDIQSLVVEMTLNLFYAQMQSAGSSRISGAYRELTKMILVDEADHFMSEGYPSLRKILKEGREFGVGVILSTQFLRHFQTGDDDYARYIMTWIVHNVSDLKPGDVDFVFRTNQNSEAGKELYREIRRLEQHCSIVKIGTDKPVAVRNLPFWKLVGET